MNIAKLKAVQALKRRLQGLVARQHSLVSDGMFTMIAKGTSQLVQLLIFIIGARVLTSAEFGFFAFTSAFVVMLIVLAEGGWGEFLMKSHNREADYDQVATTAMISGLIVSTLALAGALAMGSWFGDMLHLEILVISSVLIFACALSTIYDGILVAQGRLKDQAKIRIISELVGLAVVAAGLWSGWNIIALFAGRLAAQLTSLGCSMLAVLWLPKIRLTRPFLREILGFSRHILANRLIVFLRSYSATLAVGGFLGLAEAGYYRAAERIVASISELLAEPARLLGWVVFRKARDRQPQDIAGGNARIATAANSFVVLLIAIAAPFYLGLSLASGALINFVLGDAWMPAAIVVSILAIRQLLLIPAAIIEPLLSMVGELRRLPPIALMNGGISIALIVALAPFGLIPLALGQVAVGAFWLGTMIWLQQRHGGLDWSRIARRCGPTLAALGAMLLADFALNYITLPAALPNALTTGFQVAGGAIAYVAVLAILHKLVVATAEPLAQQRNS